MAPDNPTDEHPNLRRARFDALARDELVEPLRRHLAARTDPGTADEVLAATLLVCWQRLDEIPDPALPWALRVAQRELESRDPAASGRTPTPDADAPIAPADPAGVARLLADVVGEHTDTESRQTGTRGRSWFTWLVAAVALLLIAAAAYAVLRERTSETDAAEAPTVVTVALPDDAATQRCAMPSPEALRRADLAFDAEVSEVSGTTVVLDPSRVYTGQVADRVRVAQAPPSRVNLILGVRFTPGQRYLVAVSDGQVMVCGFSGTFDEARAELYDEAFGT